MHRIHDIANTLLAAVNDTRNPDDKVDTTDAVLVSALLDCTISEKRAEYRHHLDLSLDLQIARSSYGAFTGIDLVEIKRAVSHIINNAVDALFGKGAIRVQLTASDNEVQIAIADNGCGIPQRFLALIGERGRTLGKAEGNGLGLPHAMQLAQSVGGSLNIQSAVGCGTVVTFRLPRVGSPDWFMEAINLHGVAHIVILDDESMVSGENDSLRYHGRT